MSKIYDLLNGKYAPPPLDIIVPIPDIVLEHYGAADGGHAVQVDAHPSKDQNEIVSFVERETGLTRWLVRVGFPKPRKERKVWVLIR